MSWASLTLLPLVLGYQAWTYWIFRRRITADGIPPSIGLSRRRT
jgi:cytochrome d ubiquinol oxidase subunit II